MKPIFIHIPKCGGTTIRRVFKPRKPIWEIHGCAQEISDEIGANKFATLDKFAIVRNPFNRLVSWFEHHARTDSGRGYYDEGFTNWVEKGCPHHFAASPLFGKRTGCKYAAYLYAPTRQAAFLSVDNRIPSDIEIFKLEEIGDWWKSVAAKFESNEELQHFNRNKARKPYESYYNETTRRIASELCAQDLQIFNYEFGD